jgi:hypothetical protein
MAKVKRRNKIRKMMCKVDRLVPCERSVGCRYFTRRHILIRFFFSEVVPAYLTIGCSSQHNIRINKVTVTCED